MRGGLVRWRPARCARPRHLRCSSTRIRESRRVTRAGDRTAWPLLGTSGRRPGSGTAGGPTLSRVAHAASPCLVAARDPSPILPAAGPGRSTYSGEEPASMAIQKVGVVGCGLMGSGIAQVSAQAGFPDRRARGVARRCSTRAWARSSKFLQGRRREGQARRRPTWTRRSRTSRARPSSRTSPTATS